MRAKRTIRDGGFPYEVPEGAELASRLSAVLAVLYLIFNEGYAAHSGDDLVRHDLCDEAIRLGRVLAELMPREPEVLGLLALMELQASRARGAHRCRRAISCCSRIRTGSAGTGAGIERGLGCLERAGPLGARGGLPAAGGHRRLSRAGRVLGGDGLAGHREPLPGALAALAPSPVVDAEPGGGDRPGRRARGGPGRARSRSTIRRLRDYHLLPAARAEFLRRLGRAPEAAVEYRRALGLVDNPREHAFLAARLAACEAGGGLSPQR